MKKGIAGFLKADAWLSRALGVRAYRLDASKDRVLRMLKNGSSTAGLSPGSQKVFIDAKVDPQRVSATALLEGAGFRLVDTHVKFSKSLATEGTYSGCCELRFALPRDKAQVMEIARRGFEVSRFHLDPHIGAKTAGRIKQRWAGNFFTGKRGDRMVVALVKGRIVGFNLLIEAPNKELIIDLVAVHPSQRRKGIARDMILFAQENLSGFKRVSVGTQLANLASIRLYESMGFDLVGANHVFHYHSKVSRRRAR